MIKQPYSWNQFFFVSIALLLIILAVTSIVWSMNPVPAEDWHYIYQGQQRNLFDSPYQDNRGFLFMTVIAADILFPARFQSIHMLTLTFWWLNAVALFYAASRLLDDMHWLAFFLSVLAIAYIPSNSSAVDTIGMAMAPLVLFLILSGFLILVEYTKGKLPWWTLILAGFLAYVPARAAEIVIPFVGVLPIIMIVVGRLWSRRAIVATTAWWIGTGIGAVQFLMFFLLADEDKYIYQRAYQESSGVFDFNNFIANVGTFYELAFSPAIFPPLSTDYIFVPLVVTGIFAMVALRLRAFDARFPRPALLIGLLLGGILMTFLGGVGYVYADLPAAPRAHFFAAMGEGMAVIALLGLVAWGIHKIAKINPQKPLVVFALVLVFISTQWFYHWQTQMQRIPSLDEKNQLYRDLTALLPALEDNTLILFNCDPEVNATYRLDFESPYAIRYLYDFGDGSAIQMAEARYQTYLPDGVQHTSGYDRPPAIHYNYDEMVVVGCNEYGLYVEQSFPGRYGPSAADTSVYDPHSRIRNTFVPSHIQRALSR